MILRLSLDSIFSGDYVTDDYFNLVDLVRSRSTSNLLVSGSSGSGKSELVNYMLMMWSDPEIIFSFKPYDAYLSLPSSRYTIINVSKSPPVVFGDPDSFVQAYEVAFPIDVQGITSSQIVSLLYEGVHNSSCFQDLKDFIHSKTGVKGSGRLRTDAYNTILANISLLVPLDEDLSSDVGVLDNWDIVLDFSGLNERAKTFYAEFFLRAFWKRITSERSRYVLCVDEVHRLARSSSSVVFDVMRQIRQYGAFWSASQNLSDIPDNLLNQFFTIFAFSTIHSGDLAKIRAINDFLPVVVSNLRPYSFLDLRNSYAEKMDIPIFMLDYHNWKVYLQKKLAFVPVLPDVYEGFRLGVTAGRMICSLVSCSFDYGTLVTPLRCGFVSYRVRRRKEAKYRGGRFHKVTYRVADEIFLFSGLEVCENGKH